MNVLWANTPNTKFPEWHIYMQIQLQKNIIMEFTRSSRSTSLRTSSKLMFNLQQICAGSTWLFVDTQKPLKCKSRSAIMKYLVITFHIPCRESALCIARRNHLIYNGSNSCSVPSFNIRYVYCVAFIFGVLIYDSKTNSTFLLAMFNSFHQFLTRIHWNLWGLVTFSSLKKMVEFQPCDSKELQILDSILYNTRYALQRGESDM